MDFSKRFNGTTSSDLRQEQPSRFGTLKFCHFSNIKEQTQNDVEKAFRGSAPWDVQVPKRDQRCYYQDTSLRIYSRGGSEFIVPLHFQVGNVFPIENGLIVQILYDRDLLYFDPLQISKNQSNQSKPQEYAYVTITDHPLDDLHPLSLGGKTDLLSTSIQILHISYKLPFVVLFNPKIQQVIFGLLKHCQEDTLMQDLPNQQQEDGDSYIKTIEPESRHPELFNLSKNHKIFIQELYSFQVQSAPTQVFIAKSNTDSYEMQVQLFYSQHQRFEVYACDIRQPKSFKKSLDISGIKAATQIHFSRQKYSSDQEAKVISKTKANIISQSDARQSMNLDLKIMKKRIKLFTKDTILCDSQGRQIHIYQGISQIFSFDFVSYMENLMEKGSYQKISKIESFEQPSKSNVTVHFNNNISKRVSMRMFISDFLIKSIMKTLNIILPSQLFESLNQDLLDILIRCNLEPSKYLQSDLLQDQFTKFSNMILGILTGDQQYLMKQVSVSQIVAQQVQQPAIQQQARPTQTLQTKILRSSTTSFGTDSMATRRKTLNQPVTQQVVQQQPQRLQQNQIRTSVLGSSSLGQAQQRRLAISGGSDSTVGSIGANNTNTMLSSNPFADLLNSDFHKDNFKTSFSELFPADMKLSAQVALQQIQDQQPVQISPTKQPLKTTTQRISSTRQSNVLQSNHERRNSNLNQTFAQAQTTSSQPQTQLPYPFKTQKQDLLPHFQSIFTVLHLLYEDLKLNKLRDSSESPRLARFLIKLALAIEPHQKISYIDYYLKEHPHIQEEVETEIKKHFKDGRVIKEGVEIQSIPKIYKWLEEILKRESQTNVLNYPYPLFFERSRKIVRIYEIINGSQCNSVVQNLLQINQQYKQTDYEIIDGIIFNRANVQSYDMIDQRDYLKLDKFQDSTKNLHLFEKVLFTLKEENMNLDELKKLPSIISLPIMEILRYSRLYQQEIQTLPLWPESLYKLIQREDILNNLRLFHRPLNQASQQSGKHPHELTFQKQSSKKFALTRGITNVFAGNTLEEMQQEGFRKEMETNILKTAAHLINDQVKSISKGGNSDEKNNQMMDFLKNRFANDTRFKEVQNMLASNTEITIKLEQIQGRESLGEEALNTEKQKLLDRMFLRHMAKNVGRGALSFGTVQNLPTETLHIPKINQTGYVPMNETYMQVEFKDEPSKDVLQWPDFHNGVAAALRIAQSFNKQQNGSKGDIHQSSHTRNWIMYHKPAEPKYEHGGFLLAIGLLGQFDTLQPTDIYQHLKSTHDATTIGILLGRAASKIGSMDDHDTRTLCIHIPYLLPPTLSIDISLSIQSAAVIGAGLLYKGTSNRLMTEMLLAQIGRKPLSDKAIEREGYALASGIALGLVNLGIGSKMQGLTDLKLDERLIRYVEGGKIIDLPQSMLSQNFNHDNTKCSSIKEGDMVNVHITSQGALIALALIHLKSNNKTIANQLVMPQTFYSLESVRPAFLLLKVLCKNLIMWDEIKASKRWIQSQVPQIIRDIYENDIQTVEKMFNQKQIEDGIDYSTVALCYINTLAGAVFALGFKYAGTGNKKAFAKLHHYYQIFRKLKVMQSNKDQIGMIHSNFTKNQIDKNTVETVLCVVAFSMSMIMAGTGDIEAFKALRVLRKRFEHDMHYGYNMAIHMSLGFLFLGSGAFTFSRNDLAIASLLCSLYPIFPSHPGDNRYHLQALRHFYVLAIESRLLQARDIDSGEFLNIEMNVEVEEDSGTGTKSVMSYQITTPDIINGTVRSIIVKNDKYHSVNLKIESGNDSNEAMVIDEQNNSNNLIERRQKVNEQFDFQKIVYVKKKASSQIQDQNQNQQQFTFKNVDQNLSDNLERIDCSTRNLIEESKVLYEGIQLIKDPTIEAFYKNFTYLDDLSQTQPLTDVEDVLLAQNRDPFSQLSPAEFFKVQDLFDQFKENFQSNYLPMNLKQKLILLYSLHEAYYKDRLELTQSHLDLSLQLHSKPTFKVAQIQSLLQSYLAYRQSSQSKLTVNSSENTAIELFALLKQSFQTNSNIMAQKFQKFLINYHNYDYNNFALNQLARMDVHELQVAKRVVEQVLRQLREMGEEASVKKYKFNKVNGMQVQDEQYYIEINEILKMSIQQVLGNQIDSETIDQVIITGLLEIERSEVQ